MAIPATPKRNNFKVQESIQIFETMIANKTDFFRLKKLKTTDDFFKLPVFAFCGKEPNSIRNHVDNCRRAFRKKNIELSQTGNNDSVKEIYNSMELYKKIQECENEFFPKGSNISPACILEPGKSGDEQVLKRSAEANKENTRNSPWKKKLKSPSCSSNEDTGGKSNKNFSASLEEIVIQQSSQMDTLVNLMKEQNDLLNARLGTLVSTLQEQNVLLEKLISQRNVEVMFENI